MTMTSQSFVCVMCYTTISHNQHYYESLLLINVLFTIPLYTAGAYLSFLNRRMIPGLVMLKDFASILFFFILTTATLAAP